ncbi:DNA helicase UvrD [Candidatus Micrarchaeota archaeon]|nr:DNA helicase UvrD [Candidatus Micrarchaeota archaeon]MBD3417653.1 DNA helicase UvrD [Candidatus Micrarchaeota archaeon]
MQVIADLHLHSKYSRATSPHSDMGGLAEWARIKGVGLLGTGDFTHPKWLKELRQGLTPSGEGLFEHQGINFMLTAEVSNIFEIEGQERTKKVHTVLFAPSFEVVEQINDELKSYGNLAEDGRPTLMMDVAELLDIVEGVSKEIMFVPAHLWTPWFGLFGSKSGFNSMEEAFGKKASHIKAVETGLSSDPEMNWMLPSLDNISLISNSDAHSPQKLAREANVFELQEVNYKSVVDAIVTREGFVKTYEFYPDEGKYHWDGHRKCGVWMDPVEARKLGNRCPKCGKPLTVGVMHRVVDLANREQGYKPKGAVPFTSLVPLTTVIAAVRGRGEQTKGVREEYFKLINYFGTEFRVLEAPKEELRLAADKVLADAIVNAREGKVHWRPGYDGVFGELSFSKIEQPAYSAKGQKSLMDF